MRQPHAEAVIRNITDLLTAYMVGNGGDAADVVINVKATLAEAEPEITLEHLAAAKAAATEQSTRRPSGFDHTSR